MNGADFCTSETIDDLNAVSSVSVRTMRAPPPVGRITKGVTGGLEMMPAGARGNAGTKYVRI